MKFNLFTPDIHKDKARPHGEPIPPDYGHALDVNLSTYVCCECGHVVGYNYGRYKDGKTNGWCDDYCGHCGQRLIKVVFDK